MAKDINIIDDAMATAAAAETASDEPKEVVSRFRPSELEIMKHSTGAERDGTAVAAFCRKMIREIGGR